MFIDDYHSNFLLQSLSSLRNEKELCDVELIVGDENVPLLAHKVVLAAVSVYFKAMFTTQMEESFIRTIYLRDTDEKCVSMLIDFAYTGHISLSVNNVQSILVTANMLGIFNVVSACCDFLSKQLDSSNCLGFAEFAYDHSLKNLKSICMTHAAKNFKELIMYDDFLTCSIHTLKNLISQDNLKVSSEEDIFFLLEQWVLYDEETRIESFYTLFNDIRLYQLNTKFLEYLKLHSFFTSTAGQPHKLRIDVFYNIKSNPLRLLAENKELYLSQPRRSSNDNLFLSGGKDGLLNNLKSCTFYNGKEDRWIECQPLPMQRIDACAVYMNGKIYVCGGRIISGTTSTSSVVEYSPYTKCWSQFPDMAVQRCAHTAVNIKGTLYAMGGYNNEAILKCVERYDQGAGKWEIVEEMNYRRSSFAAVVLEECIYVLGGQGSAHLSTVERYDTMNGGDWELMPAMSSKRINFGAAQLHGFIFVVGGHDGTNYLRSVERFDPVTNEWTTVAPLSSPRTGIGVAVLHNEIYVVGGHDGQRYLSTVSKYNPLTDSWRELKNMATPRCYMACAGVCLS